MRRRARNMRDASRIQARHMTCDRLSRLRQHHRTAADDGAQEYLKAAIAANVIEGRPDRRTAARLPTLLLGILLAVGRRTATFLASITPADLDRIVDRRWDPPVTLGVRLVSIADDSLQHLGQAAFLRGLLGR